jgi:beta-lactamase superfamily II metal-dependent hydrolase
MSEENVGFEPSKDSIVVRMYDLGEGQGDCFLLRFLDDNELPYNILIDCGSYWRTKDEKSRFEEIAKDIVTVTNKHVNVLIVTHEHWDHLSGFSLAEEEFSKLVIDEVWMAWTENTAGDELAESLNKKYEKVRNALAAVSQKFEGTDDPWVNAMTAVLSFSKNSDKVMDNIRDSFGSNPPRFCYPEHSPIVLPGVSNLRFFVLGPLRNKGLLKELAAEKAVHGEPLMINESTSFAAAVLSSFGKNMLSSEERSKNKYLSDLCLPFDQKYGLAKKDALLHKVDGENFFEEYYGPDDPKKSWRHIENDWLFSAGNMALQMDGYTNNTSLVLAIEMLDTGKVLLFTGDAEKDIWECWSDLEWTVDDLNGESLCYSGLGVVSKTGFLKVAHHGSVNGTLVDFLDEMKEDLVAMMPVNRVAAEKKGWDHPNETLLGIINDKTSGRLIRADYRVADQKHPSLSMEDWTLFKSRVKGKTKASNDLWVEYKFS